MSSEVVQTDAALTARSGSVPNTESAGHSALGREREGEACGPTGRGRRGRSNCQPSSHRSTACHFLEPPQDSRDAGSSETPSHSSSSIPLSRPSSGAKMGKVACLRYQVSHPLLLPAFCVISGDWGLSAPCSPAATHLPSFQVSIFARESESLTYELEHKIFRM